MTWLRINLFNICFYVFTFSYAMVIFVACYLVSETRVRKMIAGWGAVTKGLVRLILGGRVLILDEHNVPKDRPYIVAPKHQSELDVAVIFRQHWNCNAVVMQELADLPFLGKFIRTLNLISVSVEGGSQGKTEQIIAGARAAEARGQPILIYPEGELMALGAKERYKSGVYNIYSNTNLPVLPVAQSLGAIWPKREWNKKPGRTGAIRYLPPIEPGLGKEEFMAKLEDMVESETMALIRQHATGAELAAAEDRYARGAANE